MAYADSTGKKEKENLNNPIAPPAVGNRPADRTLPTVGPNDNNYEEPPDTKGPDELEPAPIAPPEEDNGGNEDNGGGGDDTGGGDDGYTDPYVPPKEQQQELDLAGLWEPHYNFDEETGEAEITEENPVQLSSDLAEEQTDVAENVKKKPNAGTTVVPEEPVQETLTPDTTGSAIVNPIVPSSPVAGQNTDILVGRRVNTATDEEEDEMLFPTDWGGNTIPGMPNDTVWEDVQKGIDSLANLGVTPAYAEPVTDFYASHYYDMDLGEWVDFNPTNGMSSTTQNNSNPTAPKPATDNPNGYVSTADLRSYNNPIATDVTADSDYSTLAQYAAEYPIVQDLMDNPAWVRNTLNKYHDAVANGVSPDLAWEQAFGNTFVTPDSTGIDDTIIAGAANLWNDLAGEDKFVSDVMAGKEFETPEDREAFETTVREIYEEELANGMNPYYGPRVTAEDVQKKQEEFKNERSQQITETADWTKNNIVNPIGHIIPEAWETPVPITNEIKTAARQELVDYASEYPEIAAKLNEPYFAQNAVEQYLELISKGTPKDLAWEQVLSGDLTKSSLWDNLGGSGDTTEGKRQADADTAARNVGLDPSDPAYYEFVDNYLGSGIDPRYGLKEPMLEGNYVEPEPVVTPNIVDYSPFSMTDTEASRHHPNYTNPFAGYTGNPYDLYDEINTTGGHWNLNDALNGMYSDNKATPQIYADGTMNDAMKELLFAAVDRDGNDLYVEFDPSGNPHYYHLQQNSNGLYEYVPYYDKAERKYKDDPFSILMTYVNSNYDGTGSLFKGMDWINDLDPDRQAGMRELLATMYRGGDASFGANRPSGDRSDKPYEVADLTKDQYDLLAELFIKNMPALQKLMDAGILTDKDITEFFFKDLKVSPQKPKNTGDKKNGGYGYRSYGGRGGGGRGGGSYRGGSGGSTYFQNPTQLGTPNRGGGSAAYSRGGGGIGSSGGTDISRASEPSQTSQRQNRVYNIMKNWSF